MVTTNDPCQLINLWVSGLSSCSDATPQGSRDNMDLQVLREKLYMCVGPRLAEVRSSKCLVLSLQGANSPRLSSAHPSSNARSAPLCCLWSVDCQDCVISPFGSHLTQEFGIEISPSSCSSHSHHLISPIQYSLL